MWGTLALFHLTPLLRWERGPGLPDQAVLFDIAGSQIYFFGINVWSQELYILTGVLILAAVGLFFSAALWGRAWCGFTCFQTVWTDLFVKVEAWAEGDRNARIRLDQSPWSVAKVAKRATKHFVWLLISAAFSVSFLWYFNDVASVTDELISAQLGGWGLATFFTMMGMTYVMAGFAREQVCLYMCPYGRFQGVMFDENSKLITYESWRGEGRQKPGKTPDFTTQGHCVDCTVCVQVCPTGVDIREGQQMACIGCGLCIDACNSIMEKFNLPQNLISYDSHTNIAIRSGKVSAENDTGSRWKIRSFAYLSIITITLGLTVFSFSSRELTKMTLIKDRSPFFVSLSSGQVQNAFTVRVLNKENRDKNFQLATDGHYRPFLKIIGHTNTEFSVKAGEVLTLRVIARGQVPILKSQPLDFVLRELNSSEELRVSSVFHGPGQNGS